VDRETKVKIPIENYVFQLYFDIYISRIERFKKNEKTFGFVSQMLYISDSLTINNK